jgi:hypothetical protein
MKAYIEKRDRWWRNSWRVIIIGGLIVSVIMTLVFTFIIYVGGFLILPDLELEMDFLITSIMLFVIIYTLVLFGSAITYNREHIVMFIGSEDRYNEIILSIENNFKDSNIHYKLSSVSTIAIANQFKLTDLKCHLNIFNKSKEIKPHTIFIGISPITKKNQSEINTIKYIIEEIMKNNNFAIYREYKSLIRYSESF